MTRMVPAYMAGTCTEPVDVVMIFTKAYQIRDVLTQNRALIGPDTLLLTLQNGAGHDRVMREFADSAHVLVGTTKQGSSRESGCVIASLSTADSVRQYSEGPPRRASLRRILRGWRNCAAFLRSPGSPALSATTFALKSGTSL